MPDVEFDVSLNDGEQSFSTEISGDVELAAEFSAEETFDATMADDDAVFDSEMTDDSAEFNSVFNVSEVVETAKVTSVNGMVGDVVIENPYINSVELVGNKTFGQLGVHIMTNMELEELLT